MCRMFGTTGSMTRLMTRINPFTEYYVIYGRLQKQPAVFFLAIGSILESITFLLLAIIEPR